MRALALTACLLVCVACADGASAPGLPTCAPLAELSPLAAAECHEGDEAIAFEARVWSTIEEAVGGLLVRVELDDGGGVRGVCADGVASRTEWRSRRDVAARIADLLQVEPGPACLAGSRLDLNRRAAKLAELDAVRFLCDERLRATLDTSPSYVTRRFLGDELRDCIEYEATWVLVYRVGVMQPLVFGKPEIPNPAPVRARDTASRCSRRNHVDAEIACIESEGWELLE